MATLKGRIARVENEFRFQRWFYFSRFLEGLTVEQVEAIAHEWRFPEPLPEPLLWGMSELDRLDQKTLLRRFQESERETSRIMREIAEHSEDGGKSKRASPVWISIPMSIHTKFLCRFADVGVGRLSPNNRLQSPSAYRIVNDHC